MPLADKNAVPERLQTDASLRTERQKTDDELARTRARIEEDANDVVTLARQRADKTLKEARARADARLEHSGASAEVRETARREQADEDAAVDTERAVADAQLVAEREQRKAALAALLHLERAQTDRHLLVERARSDETIGKRDDFLGMVSHDLRTILGGIALNTARLIRAAPDDEAGRKTIEIADSIQRASARMNRLIGDLIDVTSIESGRLAVTPERHDAVRLLQDAMEAFQPLAIEKQVSLESEIVQDPLLAKFDHERILQVLGNLLSNAIKFTPAHGQVRVKVEAVGREVRFSVSDTGTGIPADQKEAIFERFWQVSPHDHRGVGLGLFISRCIVEAHGGRIWVERSDASGSTFCFTLPGAPGQPTEAAKS